MQGKHTPTSADTHRPRTVRHADTNQRDITMAPTVTCANCGKPIAPNSFTPPATTTTTVHQAFPDVQPLVLANPDGTRHVYHQSP